MSSLRHESSLEQMFDFSPGPVFANDTQREQAISRF